MDDEGKDLGIRGVSGAREIGRGGFGIVYRARQDAFDRTVAVKVLDVRDVDEDVIRRFERELRAVGALSGHPSIVSVHAHGATADGQPYLLMEYCAGGSFGAALAERGRFGWEEATSSGVSIAGAVETAHRAGILHRDIKPDNLLTDAYGTPKLTDFGIARINSQASTTRTGSLTGSPAHISPELIAGQEPTPSSDVYSLASTVHTLLAGTAPFQRDDDSSILPLLNRILHEDPPDLRQLGVPDPVCAVLSRGMAKDPAHRFSTALEFGEALQRARVEAGVDAGGMHVVGESPRPAPSLADANSTVAGATTLRPPAPPGSSTPEGSSGSPASGPGKRSKLPVLAAAVVLLVAALAGVALATGGDGGTDQDTDEAATPASTSTSSAPSASSSTSASTPSAVAESTPIEPAALLFPLAELPVGYVEAPPELAEVDPAEGFCNTLVDVSEIERHESIAYQQSETGPFVLSAVAVFSSPDAAAGYVAEMASTVACGTWVDEDGLSNSAVYVAVETAAEESDGFSQLIETPVGVLDGDVSLVRQGRVVATIGNIAFRPNDKSFSDFLTVRQAELLVFGPNAVS